MEGIEMTETCDKQCLELAKVFIKDCYLFDPTRREFEERLAEKIQKTIEDFMEDNNLQ